MFLLPLHLRLPLPAVGKTPLTSFFSFDHSKSTCAQFNIPVVRTGAELKEKQTKKVSRDACTVAAFAMGLHTFVQCGNGTTSNSVLAEAYEAVLGAVFEDGGYDAAAAVWKHLQPDVSRLVKLAQSQSVEVGQ